MNSRTIGAATASPATPLATLMWGLCSINAGQNSKAKRVITPQKPNIQNNKMLKINRAICQRRKQRNKL